MAQHNFAGTPPANRYAIADSAADYQISRTRVMTQKAVWVEERAGKQAIAILERDKLTAVQMSSQDKIVSSLSRCLPDSRIVPAEHSDVSIGVASSFRARNRDRAAAMGYHRNAIMNPSSLATRDSLTNVGDSDFVVVISCYGENRRDMLKAGDEVGECVQFGIVVQQIAPE